MEWLEKYKQKGWKMIGGLFFAWAIWSLISYLLTASLKESISEVGFQLFVATLIFPMAYGLRKGKVWGLVLLALFFGYLLFSLIQIL